ncbi:MAG: TlpA disulfide reductase family protein [Bacteroidales bacterium]|jgi:peroxiredoxin
MKRTIIILFCLTLCLNAYSQAKTYIIKGSVKNNPNLELEYNDWGTKSEKVQINNGSFEIKGELAEGTYPRQASLSIVEGNSRRGNSIILEPGEITVVFDRNALTIGGTPENENLDRLTKQLSKYSENSGASFYAWQRAYNNKATEAELEQLWEKSEIIKEEERALTLKLLKENNNYASFVILPRLTRYEGAKTIEPFMKQFERYSYTTHYENLKKHYEAMARSTDGAKVKDFTLPAPDGKMVSLSDFKGKWVILDFWYVDCHWCRKLAPNLGKIYKEYKDKGLEIISISVDKESDRERMLKVIKDDGMVWTQVNDKTKKDLPEYFGVSGYPTLFLIDPKGKGVTMKVGYCEAGALRRLLNKHIK